MSIKDNIWNIFKVTDPDEEYDDEDYEYDDDEDFEEDEDPVEEAPKKSRFSFGNKSRAVEEDEDDLDMPEPVAPAKPRQTAPVAPTVNEPVSRKNSHSTTTKVTSVRGNYGGNKLNEICMVKPKENPDAQDCIDDLKDGKTVILNLEGLDLNDAQHLFDYISGASYAMGCNFETITDKVFIFSPLGVELTGAFPKVHDTRTTGTTNSFRTKYDF